MPGFQITALVIVFAINITYISHASHQDLSGTSIQLNGGLQVLHQFSKDPELQESQTYIHFKAQLEIVPATEIPQILNDCLKIQATQKFHPLEALYLASQYMDWDPKERNIRLSCFLLFEDIMHDTSSVYPLYRQADKHTLSPFFKKMVQLTPEEMLAASELVSPRTQKHYPITVTDKSSLLASAPLPPYCFPEQASRLVQFTSVWSHYLNSCLPSEQDNIRILLEQTPARLYYRLFNVHPRALSNFEENRSEQQLFHFMAVSLETPDHLTKSLRLIGRKNIHNYWPALHAQLAYIKTIVPQHMGSDTCAHWMELIAKMGSYPLSLEFPGAVDPESMAAAIHIISDQIDPNLASAATIVQKETKDPWVYIKRCIEAIVPDAKEISELGVENQIRYIQCLLGFIARNKDESQIFRPLSLHEKRKFFSFSNRDENAFNSMHNLMFLLKASGSAEQTADYMRMLLALHPDENSFHEIAEAIESVCFETLYVATQHLTADSKRLRSYKHLDLRGFYESIATVPAIHRQALVYAIADLHNDATAPCHRMWSFRFDAISVLPTDCQKNVLYAYMAGLHKNLKRLRQGPRQLESLFQTIALLPAETRTTLAARILRKHDNFKSLYKAMQLLPVDKIYKVIMQSKKLSHIYAEIFAPESLYGQIDSENMDEYLQRLVKRIENGDEAQKQDMHMFIQREHNRTLHAPNRGLTRLIFALGSLEKSITPGSSPLTRFAENWDYYNESGSEN